jgi:hypothetical protein
MILPNPQPTPNQMDLARHMLAELEQLFELGGEKKYASIIRGILVSEGTALDTWLTSGNFWGGMGSVIDCAFCTHTFRGPEIDKRNKREFISLIIKLGKQLAARMRRRSSAAKSLPTPAGNPMPPA